MKNKFIYNDSELKVDNGLSIWKCLFIENGRAIYLEYNGRYKAVTLYI